MVRERHRKDGLIFSNPGELLCSTKARCLVHQLCTVGKGFMEGLMAQGFYAGMFWSKSQVARDLGEQGLKFLLLALQGVGETVNDHSPPNQRHTIDHMRYEYDDERKLYAS